MLDQINRFVKWHRRRNPHARTWRDYSYDLHQFITVIGPKPPHTISVQDIDTFVIHESERGMSPRTINRRLHTLSTFFLFLSDTDPDLTSPILRHRHFLREPKRLPKPLTQHEVDAFFNAIDSPRDKAMFLLMLRGGLRLCEVAELKIHNLFLNEPRPRMVVLGKNSHERTVYLPLKLVSLIRALLDQRPTAQETLFLSRQGRPLSTTAIHKRLMVYRQRAGIQMTAHQLRHTFATQLLQADVPIPTIQKLMGHAWITTTQNYLLVTDAKVAHDFFNAADELEAWS